MIVTRALAVRSEWPVLINDGQPILQLAVLMDPLHPPAGNLFNIFKPR